MSAYRQPFSSQNSDERVFFDSPRIVGPHPGELSQEKRDTMLGALFTALSGIREVTPRLYVDTAYLVADECWCGVDPVCDEPTKLPHVSDAEYDYFVGIAVQHAGDQFSAVFARSVEGLAYPRQEVVRSVRFSTVDMG